jgi:putative addiction module component (TIGR02574 family)
VDEQVEYIQFLWDKVAPRVAEEPVPEWHKAILEERLRDMEENPDDSQPADEVIAELRAGLSRD